MMKWTTEKPTEPGAYWIRDPVHDLDRYLVEVTVTASGSLFVFGRAGPPGVIHRLMDNIENDDVEWCGPLVAQTEPEASPNADDVDAFAEAMKQWLRNNKHKHLNWQDDGMQRALSKCLRLSVDAGCPIRVALVAMLLHLRGDTIGPPFNESDDDQQELGDALHGLREAMAKNDQGRIEQRLLWEDYLADEMLAMWRARWGDDE